MLPLALLFGMLWALTNGRWCEQTETIHVEEEVTPRQEDLVPCTSLYHYIHAGWQLDLPWNGHVGLSRPPALGLCAIYKPPETRPATWNRTVRACCPGWGGPHCTDALAEASPKGHCFVTWQCQPLAGSANSSAGSLEECCAQPWGRSWWDSSSQMCLSCSGQHRPGNASSEGLLQPLTGATGQLWSQHQRLSVTCSTWSGFHYQTFDGHHYHFLGRCTYLLAGAVDSTWAVHLRPGLHCSQPRHCWLVQVMMGPEEVLIQDGEVSVKGQPVPVGEPRLLHGMSLQWQGDWLVLSGGLGVVVRLDRSSSISISVDQEFWGRTQGLCGLYNGQPEDDFVEPDGRLAMLAATFGNSWRLPGYEPGCLDAVEVAQGCDSILQGTQTHLEAGKLHAQAQDICHQLLKDPFWQCHAQVPPDDYHETCLFAYCVGARAGSSPGGQQEAVCTTFANYARACAGKHIYVHWRKPGFCERLCPGGQLYSDCVSSCPPSCSAVTQGQEGSCGKECVSGCECPAGLFWDGAHCVPAAHCPCYHRRQRYAPGDTVNQHCNPCVCQDGRWHCAQALCPAECAVGSDGHYITFDGRSYSFRGNPGCHYSLVQDSVRGRLLVALEHGACDTGSCLHALSVFLGNTHIQLRYSGAVLVDGQDIDLPWISAEGFNVSHASSTFLLLRWPGAWILWGVADPAAYITLDPHYAHQVQGLCGTFTWKQQDDFLTPAGDVETSVTAFASKFQVSGDGRCSLMDNTAPSSCSTYSQRLAFAETACAILHGPTFQECHGLVDREPFRLRCLEAVCGCAPGRNCLCSLLSAYARRCAQEGALLQWRNETLCPVLCPSGQEYQECAPVCGHHCGEPEECKELGRCVAGCNCPPGLLWNLEGQCVPPSMCPCQLEGHHYTFGTNITKKDCSYCVCQERGLWNCTAPRCPSQWAHCPQELIYAPGACLLTCDSPSANHSCPAGSTDGCVCPPGTVLLGKRCVPPDLCPCRHNGQWYPPNATIQEDCNICVCQGRRWYCTGQRCSGRCQASGAPHYVTFDGLVFTFPGACEYLLVRETSGRFSVSIQNLPCGASGLTCTKALTVRLDSTVVYMLRGQAVTVNGVSIKLPKVYTGPGLSLHHAGLFLLLTIRLGLTLLWDGGTRVLVQLSPNFQGRVAGLCGDFDGDASNDLQSRQGVLEPTAELTAHSWRLNPLCPEPGDLPHPCTVNTHRMNWAQARCGVILQPIFALCHTEVPPQQHYEWCVYDACGCDTGGDCECLCSAIASYADECARHKHHVRWRSQELCPLQCEGGQVYEACGSTCPPTCHDRHPETRWHCQTIGCVEGCFCPEGTLLHGEACVEPAACPCEWGGSFFPTGTVLQKDCGNCTCQASQWHCGGNGVPCEEMDPGCAEGEAPCRKSGHCVPLEWLCDNQDDCGDGSDEEGCATSGCGEGQMSCRSGHCLSLALLCDGQDDCGDGTDEQGCPCPHGSLACADGRCLPPALLCDGHPDCLDASDEESCLGQVSCTSREVSCVDGTCIGTMQLCDGVWDCPDGADEGPVHCSLPSLPTPPAGTWQSPSTSSLDTAPSPMGNASPVSPCGGLFEFECSSGECTPQGWRCDQEEDCADGSDELGCGGPCTLYQVPCAHSPHCVSPGQLCDGVAQCPDGSDEGPDACERLSVPGGPNRTDVPCPEFSCPNGTCIDFLLVCDGNPDCELANEAEPSLEEQGCGVWGSWGPWEPCSHTCGPGVQSRSRHCSPSSLPVLQSCPGPQHQSQACFSEACPVDGEWSSWSPWSLCSDPCGGTTTRHRQCRPPQNGGQDCALLPGTPRSTHQANACPQEGCSNATCSGELVFQPCAPCPLTCVDISGQTTCSPDRPCSSPGCWCPEGQVLGTEGQCVRPRQCPCLVNGTRYWPGQRIKMDCQVCFCQDGRPHRCQPNPECSVDCGWSSWSPWAECLGSCSSQSLQWSFRSPNNPRLSGRGRQCRGIHRKARRCQTEPCEGCEQWGLMHHVGERWRGGPCTVCECLHRAITRCSPYCPLGSCPQGWILVEGMGESCCHCALPGKNQIVIPMSTQAPVPSPQIEAALVTYVLPPLGDGCYSPLGLAQLPMWASSKHMEYPTQATMGAPTTGPGPREGAYAEWHAQPRYLQLDLLQPRNLTGIMVQGVGSSAAHVTSLSLQFSSDGLQWHDHLNSLPNTLPPPTLSSESQNRMAPEVWTFNQMIQARYVRVWPHNGHHHNGSIQHDIFLWVELLGCKPVSPLASLCPGTSHHCASGECVPKGESCDDAVDCKNGSNEEACRSFPASTSSSVHSTVGTSALSSPQPGTFPSRFREGLADTEHQQPNQESSIPTEGPSMQTVTTISPFPPGTKSLHPGMAAVTVLPLHSVTPVTPLGQSVTARPFPPVWCGPGQMPCDVLGCIEQKQLCDGREDCLDGSDEQHCASAGPFTVPTTAVPGFPASMALCSPSQLSCGSGECLPHEQRCDLQLNCQDGSDEDNCVDCVLAPWSGWSDCSRSCGLGLTFRRRELLRPPLPGGSCLLDQLRSQPCFVQACPVAGAWTEWGPWEPCSVSCGGGHQNRQRSCVDPPPKNGGAPCPGPSHERAPCSLQLCPGDTDCEPGRVHVTAELCQKGLVPPCPPTCLDPEANRSCGGRCVEGCRCPPGLFLQDSRCLPLSECPCLVGQDLRQPGLPFLLDNCSQCTCEKGVLLCEPGGCSQSCGWSAWSPWTPCDHSCGSGVRTRFRSPSNPPAAFGGAPCEGDSQELQACYTECGTETPGWTPWTSWSSCSQSCLVPGGDPGWRQRSRLCSSSRETFCLGEATQEEPCSLPVCSVPSAWGLWVSWSTCSASCNGGIQTRGRSCLSPGNPVCPGPHTQTRDCNTHSCTAQCPGNMVFRSAEQCHEEGGPCPQLCLAQDPGVECIGICAPSCSCPPGLFLHNASCLPRSQCPCQLRGQLYTPGEVVRLDCNNCTCVSGEMVCTSELCPVACGWSPWTPWSLCSQSCNVGIRQRFRAGTAPPAAFGGAECQGPNIDAEFCSLRPCQGPGAEWSSWTPCSVPCGGGYRNRTQGSGPHSPIEFSTCSLQPCAGPVPGICPKGQQWLDCAQGPTSCAHLNTPRETNQTCQPGCYCLSGMLLLNNVCVPAQDCPCTYKGRLHPPGSVVVHLCENCSCISGLITNCSSWPCEEGQPAWSPWTPWSVCSTSCSPARRHRHRFCVRPPSMAHFSTPLPTVAPIILCPGSEAEEEPCHLPGCDQAGSWSPWGPWSGCSRSCGGGLRSRTRACDQPPPQGLGDFCEGPQAQGETCQTQPCPVINCSTIEGAEYSPCGPPCPRSCDDLVHCVWQCQPGCYCSLGKVLSADGTICVQPSYCSCLDLLTGKRHHPGAQLPRPDGCNHCTCMEGRLNCTDLPCQVPGGWCPWSEWTTCSQPCRGQTRTRSRACVCPAPQHGGAPCPEEAGETGVQHQRGVCPDPTACPVDGAWSPWGPWSPCDTCLGRSSRSRVCQHSPSEGGRPCPGSHQQSRPCRDGSTQCTDCGGGQDLLPCGQGCPHSCQDLSLGSSCLPGSAGCQPGCGCPPGQLSQDGLCVLPADCHCHFQPRAMGIPENQSRSVGSTLSSWESLKPGEVVTGPCDNCTCVAGVLQCHELPSCPGPGMWSSWGPWEECSVSCGGGEQLRSRHCARPPCPGLARQSRICHTQACRETSCPVGRLYRECQPSEGCPFSCAHITGQMACFSESCEEGCRCPEGTFQHHLACVQECPCVLTALLLQELGTAHGTYPTLLGDKGQPLGPGDELHPGQMLQTACGNCSCVHGKLSCSLEECSRVDGNFGPWSMWSQCSRSCGGLGTRTRTRQCVHLTPAPGGRSCHGPLQDLEYCFSPGCPGTAGSTVEPAAGPTGGWGPWSPWSPCSHSCTDPLHPTLRSRTRICLGNCTLGGFSQERPCNLPSCTALPPCAGPGCEARNCSWTSWAPWEPCSRSCGVGQQRRLRAYHPPGPGGHWCSDILTAYQERRFCNLRACPVPGGWSRWSHWSWCDRSCGGGRSLRSRRCSSPTPKNGGAACVGERLHVRSCNPMPCEEGCPSGMEIVSCANRCPHSCSDLQEGVMCQEDQTCQLGCRCSEGFLEQDGGCVPIGHCECTDAQGRSWAPGSQYQDACNNCSCHAGRLLCTAQPCMPPAHCAWSPWSAWSPCSHSCGPRGQQSRFRSSTSGSWALECQKEQSQSQSCPEAPCPPLCPHEGHLRALGDSWLQGKCQQCSCTPEGVICKDTECAVPGGWTLWSSWSHCSVSCGGGIQVRNRSCTVSAPQLGSLPCQGPDIQTQHCGQQLCLPLLETCSWEPWGPCSRSCGTGLTSRSGSCPCPLTKEDSMCNDTFLHLETQACYPGPCQEDCIWSDWSSWTRCSCKVLVQQRYRHQGPAPGRAVGGAPCTRLDGHFRPCTIGNCSEDTCPPPFEFQACGSPCAGLCATHLSHRLCQDLPPCQPGCYCSKGLLEQAGDCILPEQCNCWYTSGDGARVTLAPGDRVQLGCKECECQSGELQCSSQGCEGLLPLTGWSEWSPCGPCLPQSTSKTALEEHWSLNTSGLPPTSVTLLASEQYRHRLCLDPETGRPWAGDPALCTVPLSQQRLCPDPGVCSDTCQWGPWGPWSPCRVSCSGGFKLRWRKARDTSGGDCQGPWAQTESCNTGPCPGESCETQGAVFTPHCANQCPRSCADLWDGVQCLQGPCSPGCRCPLGQLVQDGHCVPIPSCRCGLPSANGSWELAPTQGAQLDCYNCTCTNGSLVCPYLECPILGPWSTWSKCSAVCGGGIMVRHRSCEERPEGAPCQALDMQQWQECNPQACPECLPGQVLSTCATLCPSHCSHLQPGTTCVREPCQLGCRCPGGQLLHNGTCISPAACPCSQRSLPWGLTLSLEEQARELPPGTVLTRNCTQCTCQGGAFICSVISNCQGCPPGEMWQHVAPGELGPCEKTCPEMNVTLAWGNCTKPQSPGCVCQLGHFRSQTGVCVPEDHCECWHHGSPHLPGSEWKEACERCHCVRGKSICAPHCPGLTCAQGEVVVQEPGSCCPVCQQNVLSMQDTEEKPASCQYLTELRNLTKGPCRLDEVEVSYCSGYCKSSTNVMIEEPYLQSQCDCCSYHLDPDSPVRILNLHCPDGHTEPVVLPVIHSCQCSACQGGDFSKH